MSLEEKLISFQLSYACKQFLVVYVCISVKTSLFSVGSFLIFVQKLIRRSVAIRMSKLLYLESGFIIRSLPNGS